MKKLMLILSILFFVSCSKHRQVKNDFESKLFSKIDSFHCDSKLNRLILVRYQKIDEKDFIQIKVNYDYNPDSLAYCKENNDVFYVFYNDDYFRNKIKYISTEKDFLLKKYDYLSSKHSGNILYHNICEEIYEVKKNDTLILVNKNNPIYNKLFNYTSTFIPPPPPPPSKK